jgi:hypothetical protein
MMSVIKKALIDAFATNADAGEVAKGGKGFKTVSSVEYADANEAQAAADGELPKFDKHGVLNPQYPKDVAEFPTDLTSSYFCVTLKDLPPYEGIFNTKVVISGAKQIVNGRPLRKVMASTENQTSTANPVFRSPVEIVYDPSEEDHEVLFSVVQTSPDDGVVKALVGIVVLTSQDLSAVIVGGQVTAGLTSPSLDRIKVLVACSSQIMLTAVPPPPPPGAHVLNIKGTIFNIPHLEEIPDIEMDAGAVNDKLSGRYQMVFMDCSKKRPKLIKSLPYKGQPDDTSYGAECSINLIVNVPKPVELSIYRPLVGIEHDPFKGGVPSAARLFGSLKFDLGDILKSELEQKAFSMPITSTIEGVRKKLEKMGAKVVLRLVGADKQLREDLPLPPQQEKGQLLAKYTRHHYLFDVSCMRLPPPADGHKSNFVVHLVHPESLEVLSSTEHLQPIDACNPSWIQSLSWSILPEYMADREMIFKIIDQQPDKEIEVGRVHVAIQSLLSNMTSTVFIMSSDPYQAHDLRANESRMTINRRLWHIPEYTPPLDDAVRMMQVPVRVTWFSDDVYEEDDIVSYDANTRKRTSAARQQAKQGKMGKLWLCHRKKEVQYHSIALAFSGWLYFTEAGRKEHPDNSVPWVTFPSELDVAEAHVRINVFRGFEHPNFPQHLSMSMNPALCMTVEVDVLGYKQAHFISCESPLDIAVLAHSLHRFDAVYHSNVEKSARELEGKAIDSFSLLEATIRKGALIEKTEEDVQHEAGLGKKMRVVTALTLPLPGLDDPQNKVSRQEVDEGDEPLDVGVDALEIKVDMALLIMEGIRIATEHNAERQINEGVGVRPSDFAHADKFTITGERELKAYYGPVFSRIRYVCDVRDKDYLFSVCHEAKGILDWTENPDTGAFSFHTWDRQFCVKTLTLAEFQNFKSMSKEYYHYVMANSNTLLPRMVGLFRLKSLTRTMYFCVYMSHFWSPLNIHRRLYLSGCSTAESLPEDFKSAVPLLRDRQVLEEGIKLKLGHRRGAFYLQVQRDAEFLASVNCVGYSVAVGVHDRDRHKGRLPPLQHYFGKMYPEFRIERRALNPEIKLAAEETPQPVMPAMRERRLPTFRADQGGFYAMVKKTEAEMKSNLDRFDLDRYIGIKAKNLPQTGIFLCDPVALVFDMEGHLFDQTEWIPQTLNPVFMSKCHLVQREGGSGQVIRIDVYNKSGEVIPARKITGELNEMSPIRKKDLIGQAFINLDDILYANGGEVEAQLSNSNDQKMNGMLRSSRSSLSVRLIPNDIAGDFKVGSLAYFFVFDNIFSKFTPKKALDFVGSIIPTDSVSRA